MHASSRSDADGRWKPHWRLRDGLRHPCRRWHAGGCMVPLEATHSTGQRCPLTSRASQASPTGLSQRAGGTSTGRWNPGLRSMSACIAAHALHMHCPARWRSHSCCCHAASAKIPRAAHRGILCVRTRPWAATRATHALWEHRVMHEWLGLPWQLPAHCHAIRILPIQGSVS
jgi:hypothetical protein